MQCVVYIAGKIVKYHEGSMKSCKAYMLAVVDGLEAAGCRLNFRDETWYGYNSFGKPVYVFLYKPS